MIAGLRARHRASFVALAVLLPCALAATLVSRREVAPSLAPSRGTPGLAPSRGTPGLAAPASPPTRAGVSRQGGVEVHTREGLDAGVVELAAPRDLALPDVLAYWSSARPEGELPNPCTLLGSFAGTAPRCFELPPDARVTSAGAGRGWISLYSLGHQEVVWTWELQP